LIQWPSIPVVPILEVIVVLIFFRVKTQPKAVTNSREERMIIGVVLNKGSPLVKHVADFFLVLCITPTCCFVVHDNDMRVHYSPVAVLPKPKAIIHVVPPNG